MIIVLKSSVPYVIKAIPEKSISTSQRQQNEIKKTHVKVLFWTIPCTLDNFQWDHFHPGQMINRKTSTVFHSWTISIMKNSKHSHLGKMPPWILNNSYPWKFQTWIIPNRTVTHLNYPCPVIAWLFSRLGIF